MFAKLSPKAEAALEKVFAVESDDIFELMEAAGFDDLKFAFVDGDWRNCDFRDKDIRGLCFNGANLEGANFHGATADNETSWQGVKLSDDTLDGIVWE